MKFGLHLIENTMFRRIFTALKWRAARALDYSLVGLTNPKLFWTATRHVINRRKRIAIGEMNALADSRLRGPEQTRPITAEALVAGLSEIMGVIDLGRSASRTSIGVAEVDFLSALTFLRHQACGPSIAINGKRVNFATPDFKWLALNNNTVEVTFVAPNFDRDVILVEAYFLRATGEWVSNNADNTQLRALRNDCLTRPGLTDVCDILGGATLSRRIADKPIDAVYTWVNHNDPDWAALYAEHSGIVTTTTDADALSRFHNNDELRYSLRAVAKNAPWINRIFVLTNCARPDWLAADDPRLIWVDHAEAIPAACLPTFNSHVIESCLHRIPDISEHFIYLNDDVFLAKPLDKLFFFDEGGASRSFLEGYGMVSGAVIEGDPDYLNASRNVAGLLRDGMGFVPTQLHQHTAFALRRSILAEIEARWQDQFDALRNNRFRTSGDINVTSFFYHHYAMATGQARIGTVNNAFVKSMDVRWRDKLKDAARLIYDTVCINEGGSDEPASDWHPAVKDFLEKAFSQKAPWEK